MAEYRVYVLQGDGRLGLADWIEAPDDEAAIAEARKLIPHKGDRCEVWRDKQLVATINAQWSEGPSSRSS